MVASESDETWDMHVESIASSDEVGLEVCQCVLRAASARLYTCIACDGYLSSLTDT